jgi:hypothetical protein
MHPLNLQRDAASPWSNDPTSQRRNPSVVDETFVNRVRLLLESMLGHMFSSEWHFLRYEWQARGTIHAHCLARLQSDPGLLDLGMEASAAFLASIEALLRARRRQILESDAFDEGWFEAPPSAAASAGVSPMEEDGLPAGPAPMHEEPAPAPPGGGNSPGKRPRSSPTLRSSRGVDGDSIPAATDPLYSQLQDLVLDLRRYDVTKPTVLNASDWQPIQRLWRPPSDEFNAVDTYALTPLDSDVFTAAGRAWNAEPLRPDADPRSVGDAELLARIHRGRIAQVKMATYFDALATAWTAERDARGHVRSEVTREAELSPEALRQKREFLDELKHPSRCLFSDVPPELHEWDRANVAGVVNHHRHSDYCRRPISRARPPPPPPPPGAAAAPVAATASAPADHDAGELGDGFRCRFGFAQPLSAHTYVIFERIKPGRFRVQQRLRRNDQYLNAYCPIMMMAFRCNMDISFVLDVELALRYLTKYVTKTEPKSTTLEQLRTLASQQARLNHHAQGGAAAGDGARKVLMQTMLRGGTARDVGAQEACHLLNDYPPYEVSVEFATVNVSGSREVVAEPRTSDGVVTSVSLLDAYCLSHRSESKHYARKVTIALRTRGKDPTLTFAEFARLFTVTSTTGLLYPRKSNYVVRFVPRRLPSLNELRHGKYCAQSLLLYKAWHSTPAETYAAFLPAPITAATNDGALAAEAEGANGDNPRRPVPQRRSRRRLPFQPPPPPPPPPAAAPLHPDRRQQQHVPASVYIRAWEAYLETNEGKRLVPAPLRFVQRVAHLDGREEEPSSSRLQKRRRFDAAGNPIAVVPAGDEVQAEGGDQPLFEEVNDDSDSDSDEDDEDAPINAITHPGELQQPRLPNSIVEAHAMARGGGADTGAFFAVTRGGGGGGGGGGGAPRFPPPPGAAASAAVNATEDALLFRAIEAAALDDTGADRFGMYDSGVVDDTAIGVISDSNDAEEALDDVLKRHPLFQPPLGSPSGATVWCTPLTDYHFTHLTSAITNLRRDIELDAAAGGAASSSSSSLLAPRATLDQLNEKQRLAYDIIVQHTETAVDNPTAPTESPAVPDPLRMLLMGQGGTGKSFVIHALKQRLGEKLRCTATTGLAGLLIDGVTLHSAVALPTRGVTDDPHNEIKAGQDRKLRAAFKSVRTLLVDEVSMLSLRDLYNLDKRLRHICRCSDVPFGGLNVVLCGDFGQLPPVGGKPLFADAPNTMSGAGSWNNPFAAAEQNGAVLYSTFLTVVCLTENMRQQGESSEQREFRGILQALREGGSALTQHQFDFLSRRILDPSTLDRSSAWCDAVYIFPTNAEALVRNVVVLNGIAGAMWRRGQRHPTVTAISATATAAAAQATAIEPLWTVDDRLLQTRSQRFGYIARIEAEQRKRFKNVPATRAGGLESTLLLTVGAPVMITANLCQQARLCNGTRAVVWDVYYAAGRAPPQLPACVIVICPDYNGSPHIEGLPHSVAIVPVEFSIDAAGTVRKKQLMNKDKENRRNNSSNALANKRGRQGRGGGSSTNSTGRRVVQQDPRRTVRTVLDVECDRDDKQRRQIPLRLASALTIHRAQGQSFDKVVVSLGQKDFAAHLCYVALSRVRSYQGLAFAQAFTFRRLQSIVPAEGKVAEDRRLSDLEQQTAQRYRDRRRSSTPAPPPQLLAPPDMMAMAAGVAERDQPLLSRVNCTAGRLHLQSFSRQMQPPPPPLPPPPPPPRPRPPPPPPRPPPPPVVPRPTTTTRAIDAFGSMLFPSYDNVEGFLEYGEAAVGLPTLMAHPIVQGDWLLAACLIDDAHVSAHLGRPPAPDSVIKAVRTPGKSIPPSVIAAAQFLLRGQFRARENVRNFLATDMRLPFVSEQRKRAVLIGPDDVVVQVVYDHDHAPFVLVSNAMQRASDSDSGPFQGLRVYDSLPPLDSTSTSAPGTRRYSVPTRQGTHSTITSLAHSMARLCGVSEVEQFYNQHESIPLERGVPVQAPGLGDCGIVAIMFALTLYAGGDPRDLRFPSHLDDDPQCARTFSQRIRDHLLLCLQQRRFTPFPQVRVVDLVEDFDLAIPFMNSNSLARSRASRGFANSEITPLRYSAVKAHLSCLSSAAPVSEVQESGTLHGSPWVSPARMNDPIRSGPSYVHRIDS